MNKTKKILLFAGIAVVVIALVAVCIAAARHRNNTPEAASGSSAAEAIGTDSEVASTKQRAAVKGTKAPDFFTYFYKSQEDNYIFGEKFFYEAQCVPLLKSQDTDYYDPYSAVPGIPFLFDYDHAQNIKTGYITPDAFIITYTDGLCSTLGQEVATVFESGHSFERPVTVYWSPYKEPGSDAAKEAVVTVVFMADGQEIGRQTLTLKRDRSIKGSKGDIYRYSAKVK